MKAEPPRPHSPGCLREGDADDACDGDEPAGDGPIAEAFTVQLFSDLCVYIGHNVLMDGPVDPPSAKAQKPQVLLDGWAAVDRWEERTTTREYSLLVTDPAEIAARVHALLGSKRHAFSQWFAAFLRRPYAIPVLTTVYVEEFPDDEKLKEVLLARRVDSGGRLRLVQPKDEGVLEQLQTIGGFPLVSDVQLYLDLLRAGLRGDEAAKELRKSPDFSGGWT